MALTKEEAACSIYGLEVTTENINQSLETLEVAGLVPVYMVNGDPTVAFALGIKKVKMEPWKYKEFNSSLKRKDLEEEESEESENSLVVTVPQSSKAVLDLVKLIMPPNSITGVTEKKFMTESDVFAVVKTYFCDIAFTAEKLNDWMGKDGAWGTSKQKRVEEKRIRGREMNVVKQELRDFTWEDVSNIKEYRKMVRVSSPTIRTIGYARKSNIRTKKEAIEKSVDLQAKKLKIKCLCESIYASCKSNADEPIYDRDSQGNDDYHIPNIIGDCQGNSHNLN